MAKDSTLWNTALGLYWILTNLLVLTLADEVILLDTTQETQGDLNWQTYPPNTGWQEASFNMGLDTVRVNTVCMIDQQESKNWLRTPFIPRGNAKRLYIEMKFTMRECTQYPDPQNLQQCKETFNLLYYEAESDYANSMLPRWDTITYRHIDVVAADSKFSSINNAVINTEVRSVAINQKGVYFAFMDMGACVTLIAVRIYYKICPEVTLNFAKFLATPTGSDSSSIYPATGECVANSAMESEPTYQCKANGEWYLNSGGCQCLPAFMPATNKHQCIECGRNTYKHKTGNEQCKICPANSHAPKPRSVECSCFDGFYRYVLDEVYSPCTKPPSPPRNLTVHYHDQSTAILKWQPPVFDGGRKDLYYFVECRECDINVAYTPAMTNFNHTRVTLSGLKPSKKYKVTIYARNGVSKISRTEWDFYEMIEFTTDAGTAAKDLNVGSTIIDGQFTLNIGSPKLSGQIEMFEIRYYPTEHPEKVASVQTKVAKLPFKNLTRNTQYAFQIRYKTKNGGWSDFSSVHYFKTGVDQAADSTPMGIIAGSIVAVAVCISIVIIMIFIFTRRNNQGCSEKNPGDCDNLQYTNRSCTGKWPYLKVTVPLFTSPGSIRSYVDPHTYEDPHQAVREFTKEIDASHITIESVIGGGEFGDVCKGKLRIPTHMEMTVAIKTLKPGASEKNRLDFLTEASIMGQFEDANVIALEGVVTKSHPIMIVTEYMENGSLDSFLRNNDGQFTVMQLVGMLRGIASGMKYLSEMGYVHRDLAARNILANENLVCKVADFGLSREIESDDTDGAYTTKGGKIPVRWTAPEAIAYRKFTSASDVWSYGVVMWEVMSYGERPYWNWSNQDVIKAVEKGYRLPPPMDCPEAIHQLMLDCWQKERSHRPKFAATVRTIDKLIRAPELLRKVAKPRPYNTYETNVDLTRYDSLEEWLISIKMERYLESFLQYGYATIDSIAKITLKDLVNMGITLVGHQKKLMNSVQTMRVQIHGATVSDGFMV